MACHYFIECLQDGCGAQGIDSPDTVKLLTNLEDELGFDLVPISMKNGNSNACIREEYGKIYKIRPLYFVLLRILTPI